MDIKIFDKESYPNLYSLASINYTTKERELYYISENHNDLDKIVEYFTTPDLFMGYNSKNYDNLVAFYILENYRRLSKLSSLEVAEELNVLSHEIIKAPKNWKDIPERIRELMKLSLFKWVDLLTLFGTVQRTSLKQISINLKFWNVQSLPYSPTTILTEEQIQEVLKYNFNDVDITLDLFEARREDLVLRKDINKRYGVDVINTNNTGIAKTILNKYYAEQTGIDYYDFKDLRSYYKPFTLKQVILRDYGFKTEPFLKMVDWFNVQVITEETDVELDEFGEEKKKKKIKHDVYSKGLQITVGLGGLHSVDAPGKFIPNKNIIYRDADVASLYPTIMINNQIKPKHCEPAFCKILETLVVERLADKKEGRKVDAEAKKIVVNSIYGLMGSQYYWLKDKKALLTVTVNGQLALCRFIEDLQVSGIKVISANTDGVVVELKKDQEKLYKKICSDWEKEFNFTLEFKDYVLYARKDVNNYISKDTKGDVKQKGKYFTTIQELHRGFWYPVVPQALNEYFLNGTKPEEYIEKHTDVYDFMCSQKADEKKFKAYYVHIDGFTVKRDLLQKNNRWIVANAGGKLVKLETDWAKEQRLAKKREKKKEITANDVKNRVIQVDAKNYIRLTNRVDDPDIKKFDIKYKFYIDECYGVINQIEPLYTQIEMF